MICPAVVRVSDAPPAIVPLLGEIVSVFVLPPVSTARISCPFADAAAGMVAVLEMFERGKLPKGFVKQESVTLDQFLATQWSGQVYGDGNLPKR